MPCREADAVSVRLAKLDPKVVAGVTARRAMCGEAKSEEAGRVNERAAVRVNTILTCVVCYNV